jgi:predicted small integral membrane protein
MDLNLNWMAWTWQTATFFGTIFVMLMGMLTWSIIAPQAPRMGMLRIETTPGDRFFISLLGSAFICLGWLAIFGAPLWGGLIVCLVWFGAVFRWV